MIWFYVSLLAAILLGVVGQMLLKAGAGGDTLIAQFSALQSILGLAFYAAAAVCYMLALRRIPVSVAFPSVSLSYVVVLGAAYWLEDEPIGWGKLTGILLICSGVFLVGRQA